MSIDVGTSTYFSGQGPFAPAVSPVASSTHPLQQAIRRHRIARPYPHRVPDQRLVLIRGMIARRALETHFQPIVDLRSGEVVGAEALSRFAQLPVRPPDAWFAEAATLGLGVELELAALTRALERLDRLPSGTYLSLNASVEAVMSDEFHATMSNVPAERIVLELTEHTPVTDYSSFARTVESLRSTGMRLAVDDAGSGFASFNHVLNLAPDVIKLDIALIRGIDHDPAKQALARALLRFGSEAFGTTFVAEGIETKGELGTLQSLGFHSGQGFILGRPSRDVGRVRLPKGAADLSAQDTSPSEAEPTGSTSERGMSARSLADPPVGAPAAPVVARSPNR